MPVGARLGATARGVELGLPLDRGRVLKVTGPAAVHGQELRRRGAPKHLLRAPGLRRYAALRVNWACSVEPCRADSEDVLPAMT